MGNLFQGRDPLQVYAACRESYNHETSINTKKRKGMWADPALGVDLGLVRPRHPSPYVSETSVGAQPGPLGVQGDESDVAEYGVPERPQASRQPHTSDHQGSLKPLRLALSSTPTNSSSSLVHSREPGRKSRSKKRSASPRSRTLSLSPPSTASPPNSPSLPRSPFPRRKSHKGREPEDETRGEGTLAAQVAALLPSLIGPVLESALSHYPAFQAAQIITHPSPEQPPIEPTALAPPPTLPPGPSLRPSVPATGIGLEGPSQEEPPNQTSVGLDGVEDHYSSSLPYPPTMTDSFEFRPFSWCDLPRSWEYSFGEGHKLVAWSPDYSLPEGWRRRDDVILKWANDEEGAKVLYKIRPLSAPASTPSRISTSNTLDALGALLENPRLNPDGHMFVDRSGDSPAVALSPNAWFPQEKGEKALDIPALFERAQDQPKTVPPRRHIPSSFPVVLPPPFAPEGLRDCLWHSGRDPALPHQLSEPEAKLLTTEASTRQDLASTISTVTAIAMMRNWLTTLATSFEDFPREELRHTLAALSTVAEGTANMASSALPPAARAFTAARLAARQSATRSAPEIARRGVVRAAPLSRGLFDQEATDRVFATVPTVIQIQQPSQPSETRDSDHLR
ncbi:uncharacterized protein LOC143023748 [Oratosquilla oratoria]|uniref:uncharacterized protein LOC143023748 n=2 Tax=Oratosquilla oratoria TaxID=337810 RepID=UPI003F76A11D